MANIPFKVEDRKLVAGPIVYLYEIDLSTALDPDTTAVFHMSPYRDDAGGNLSFGGLVYEHAEMKIDGLVTEAGGKLMVPTLTYVAKQDGDPIFVHALTRDIRGATVTRKRVYARHLDDGASPDANACATVRLYVNGLDNGGEDGALRLRLTPGYGAEGINDLSNRVLTPDSCILKYRVWDSATSSFKYTNWNDGGCPWGNPAEADKFPKVTSGFGTPYLNTANEEVTEPAQDRCSKNTQGCAARFMKDDDTGEIPIEATLKELRGQC